MVELDIDDVLDGTTEEQSETETDEPVSDDESVADQLSDNVAEDLITYFRGNIVGHEEEALLMYYGIVSGWGYEDSHHINTIGQGPPGSGKSLTKNTIVEIIDGRDSYTKTDVTKNAIVDSLEWDLALVAPMDEVDKINTGVVEVLKSSNPEDGGYTKDRNVEDQDAYGGYSPVEVSADANPWVLLYAPSSKKGGINDELSDRALKLYFNNDKFTRRGIGRKEFGHDDIVVDSADHERDYIYDAHETKVTLRQHLRSLPVRPVYAEQGPNNESEIVSRTGNMPTYVPPWVWYAAEPIFNLDDDATNRVYGMIVNLMQSSAITNHHNRNRKMVETYTGPDSTETETREAVVVNAQDVANVLCCLKALLSTTHKLTPLKRNILDAVDETEPLTESDGTTISKVQEYLEQNDIPHPSRSTLTKEMQELADAYYLTRYESCAGPKGQADAFQKPTHGGELQTPRIGNLQTHADRDDIELATEDCVEIDPTAPFDGCTDPIRDQPFVETVHELDEEFAGGTTESHGDPIVDAMHGDATGDSGTDDSVSNPKGKDTQTTDPESDDQSQQVGLNGDTVQSDDDESLGPSTGILSPSEVDADPELCTPPEKAVLDRVRQTRGDVFAVHQSPLVCMGLVERNTDTETTDFSNTIADPDHELWSQSGMASDRVINQEDAISELSQAFDSLVNDGIVNKNESHGPPAMFLLESL